MTKSRRFAVVTGATGGIGQAICRQLHEAGFGIVAQYHSNHEKAETLGQTIRDSGGDFMSIACDLRTEQGVNDVVHAVATLTEGQPDSEVLALVNNAAALLGPSFDEATVDQFDEYFAMNVRAPFFLAQRISRLMPAGGSIVNISSASAYFSSPGDIVYAMTKAALESLTRNMAEAIASSGLRVNTVVPGFTDNGHAAFQNAKAREYMSSFSVLGGVADPRVVADAVSFLISDRSSRTTGSVIDVTGGSALGARKRAVASVRELLPDSTRA